MYKKRNKRVFVAMSGGVDSSVAALILKKQGYDCVGIFIHSYNLDGCEEKDANDARRVAEKLQIPFYVWNFEREYKKGVVDYLIDGYRKGITPNPDVMCNKEIKFGVFLEKALSAGADYIATGHYVSLKKKSVAKNKRSRIFLCEAKDKNKDQSYFLWAIKPNYLKRCLFPIGNYLKSEVREMARRAGLPTAEKKDSQGICFLGKVSLENFLKQQISEKRGFAFSVDGRKVGEHRGVYFYTIGQRHINLINRQVQSPNSQPFYVAAKDVKTNTLFVAEGDNHPALYSDEIELIDLNFFNSEISRKLYSGGAIDVLARIRYRQPLFGGKLMFEKSRFVLKFNNLVKFVAAGQSAVFYKFSKKTFKNERKEMLGGGIIKKAKNTNLALNL